MDHIELQQNAVPGLGYALQDAGERGLTINEQGGGVTR